jgi:hypothetical protein
MCSRLELYIFIGKLQVSQTTRDLLHITGGFVMEERRDYEMKVCILFSSMCDW